MWFEEELVRRGWMERESAVDDYLFVKRANEGCMAFSIDRIEPGRALRDEFPEAGIGIWMRIVDRLRAEPDC